MKNVNVIPLSLHCHPMTGRQKKALFSLIWVFIWAVTPCHPFSGKKPRINKKTKKGVYNTGKYVYIENNWKKGVTSRDRVTAEQFRQVVRRCLEHIGEVPNHGNFRKWDGLLDWYALSRSIDRPTRDVLYHTLDRSGNIVEIMGRPVVSCQEIVACSESEAAENTILSAKCQLSDKC